MSNRNPSNNVYEKIVDEFYQRNAFELCTKTVLLLDRALNQCTLAKELLNDIVEELNKWHYNTSIAKVAGSSAGIGGLLVGM